ncbi:phage head-tail connector protein [Staphylococcus pseudintermedius]|uniref:phage head-tail connector protein n=1 Tax=Staphylococcus pseudintermedius TaxID=283734 RepID=UPI001599D54C|nr:phage head-tail connector protein [Staphylococcus pseudintermedius]QKN86170.1 putative head-tail connector protein [Staphylococcus virus pSp_SNUABM-J]QKN86241.1 putative head-tail connector protein [Staphylococcus virus pSp_SNUABM-S]EGQ0322848.1 phage head-tail connector protein [Staphylococcus pseudintermedius]EGQ0359828.1 phage head-tail connector protein [Staphylococcus pseudintermedius]EGQ0373418.1 phage head-tail connector protein [Staphylococcus pseudintermedius]
MSYLDDVKSRIGLNDNEQDKQLNSIINNVAAELLSRLPVDTISIPDRLRFIVVEVSTKRYNRIGAEGMSTDSQDGRSNTFERNDFEEYQSIIDALYPKLDSSERGSVNFY